MRLLGACLFCLCFSILESASAHGQVREEPFQHDNRITGVFTNMRYHDETGDVAGLEIFVVYTIYGYYAIVQQAEGGPEVPVVVKAVMADDSISFVLPREGNSRDRFKGRFISNTIVGCFESGAFAHHTGSSQLILTRRKSYWQR